MPQQNNSIDTFYDNLDTGRAPKAATIRALLEMPEEPFIEAIQARARETRTEHFGDTVYVAGLLALSNICVNDCLYCGLRKSNKAVPRFRLDADTARHSVDWCREIGLSRLFVISGEDFSYPPDDILAVISHASEAGLHVTLGMGEYPEPSLRAFRDAGCDCYTLKFETARREHFRTIKPSSDYDTRMGLIETVHELGMELGSGDIVGLADQSIDDIADDILLTHALDVNWAPVVPFLPAPGTPMGDTTPMGNISLLLREIALLRLLLPKTIITAGQPSQGSKLGFADPDGNRAALDAGANIFFVDVTPKEERKNVAITPHRILAGLSRIDRLVETYGLSRH